jgi:transaldolase
MKLYLDTADIEQITLVKSWGILDGVTTNPSHISKTGRPAMEVWQEICALVEGPVSLQCVQTEADAIYDEGLGLSKVADNAVVKIPVTVNGMIAAKRLSAQGIPINVTTCFSAVQALVAAKCGASYISPFVGRMDNVGQDGMEVVREIRAIYDNYGFETQLLFAGVRHPLHVRDAALNGADICTMMFEFMKMLYAHPLTDIAIDMFANDWKKVPQ